MYPPIKGFVENTMLDWEGKLAAIVFLPSCNFRCGYCHARHLLQPDHSDESIPLDGILTSLQKQKGWIDGIVITGGEPTLHTNLTNLIKRFRQEGLPVKLDTNGTNPQIVERLLEEGLVDFVAMDVKAPLDYRYGELAGAPVDIDAIQTSIELLIGGDVEYEFRTTVCPHYTSEAEIEGIARAVRGAMTLYLQAFRPVNCLDTTLEAVKPYDPDQMRAFCAIASKYVKRCMVRGDSASEQVAATS